MTRRSFMVRDRRGHLAIPALSALIMAAAAGVGLAGGAGSGLQTGPAAAPAPATPAAADRMPALLEAIADRHGIDALNVTEIPPAFEPGDVVLTNVRIGTETHTLLATEHTVRSPERYELLVQLDDGTLVPHEPGPVRTVRGALLGHPGSAVAGSLLEDGLHLRVVLGGVEYWIEPVDIDLAGARVGDHLVYRSADVHPEAVSCGGPADLLGQAVVGAGGGWGALPGIPEGMAAGTAPPCVAELACDADVEYFNAYGTVANTEARINAVINAVNTQYESQVGISHLITTIIVRTGSTGSDPYTSLDAQTRLCEFITEWTNNQTGIQRDLAQLFTGVELSGSTIGIAADIGNTGVCQTSGACTGGTYGTQGSYCLSQSDFNGNFSCATDLSAHEMGHLWGAFHCSCSGNTMNSSITCANTFSQGTINSIISYRNSRTCLTGSCPPPPGAPDNDDCAGAVPFNDGNGDGVIAYDTTFATTDGPANPTDTCNDFGENQTHNDIWYTYEATCTGTLTVTTCNDLHGAGAPSYDTDLVVYGPYAGPGAIDCSSAGLSANRAGCNDDDPVNPCGTGAPYSSTVEIGVTQGDTYLIRVGGWNSAAAGTGNLAVSCAGSTASDGACCFGNGTCAVLTAADCTNGGGAYLGDGTSCGGDADGDGTADACDGCPDDPGKTAPGDCGCGNPDTDSDGDGTLDCNDGCPNDPAKTAPGDCGCGNPDTDSDGDGTADCNDGCPNDPAKTAPGDCGCGNPDTDSDGDGTADCNDGCPNDPDKIAPGLCGCGVADADSDGDGTPDCDDGCPNDPAKVAPGNCGCGVSDGDSDGDGVVDCDDGCPFDPGKIAPGACGCGTPDVDSDGDGTLDCNDGCPGDPAKTAPGACGCGTPDVDSDGDGTPDCIDGCPGDPLKTDPGDCGCGNPEDCGPADTVNLADADFATPDGTVVSGSYLSTHVQDDVAQAIREEETNGNPSKRRSVLEHVWTFQVAPGSSFSFHVDAWHSPSTDNDDFVFSWSPDNNAYTDMLVVDKTADDDVLQSFNFPVNVAGTVYIRVMDLDRGQGNTPLDTVYIDEMFITSSADGGGTADPNVHVSSIFVETVNLGGGNKAGRATVSVSDENGAPVANAVVAGEFLGDIAEQVIALPTDGSGVVTFQTSGTVRGGLTVTFCVNDVTPPAGAPAYDPAENAETCDSN